MTKPSTEWEKDEVFNHDKWVEVKDAPIPNIDVLMTFIEAYRSPQAKMEPYEFMQATRMLIGKFLKTEIEKARKEGAEKAQDLASECITKEWVQLAEPQNYEAAVINWTLFEKKIKSLTQTKKK